MSANSYTRQQILELFDLPFPRLMRMAQQIHAQNFADDEVQMSTLLSIKTGGCKEDCAYCPQSAHYKSNVNAHGLLDIQEIRAAAQCAKNGGSTRFCMGPSVCLQY